MGLEVQIMHTKPIFSDVEIVRVPNKKQYWKKRHLDNGHE